MSWSALILPTAFAFAVGVVTGVALIERGSCDYRVRLELSVGPVLACIWRLR